MDTVNHTTRALSLLVSQYKNKPNLCALISAITAECDELETVFQDMFLKRDLSIAVGDQLDAFGKILDVARGTMTDEQMRAACYLKIYENYSEGTIEDLIRIFKGLTGAENILLHECWPATFTIQGEGDLPGLSLPTGLRFMGVGHSYVQGTISGLGVTDDSYRRVFYHRARSRYGMPWTLVGSQGGGDFAENHHEGVPSIDSAYLLEHLSGYLDANYPTPTANDCVLLGPIEFKDAATGVTAEDFKANIAAMLTMIDTHSPLIKTFLITGPLVPDYLYGGTTHVDLAPYVAAEKEAIAEALAAGLNVYLIDCNSQEIHIPHTTDPAGGDDLHPDWLGYEQMGIYITDKVAALVGVPTGVPRTVFSDTGAGANGTALVDHVPNVNLTGSIWEDLDSLFQIQGNTIQGVGGFGRHASIDLNQVVYKGSAEVYASAVGTTYLVLKGNDDMSAYIYLWLNTTTQKLWIGDQSSGYAVDSADFACADSTWYTFNIEVNGNGVTISNNGSVVLRFPLLSAANFTRFGIGYYPAGVSAFKNINISGDVAEILGMSSARSALKLCKLAGVEIGMLSIYQSPGLSFSEDLDPEGLGLDDGTGTVGGTFAAAF